MCARAAASIAAVALNCVGTNAMASGSLNSATTLWTSNAVDRASQFAIDVALSGGKTLDELDESAGYLCGRRSAAKALSVSIITSRPVLDRPILFPLTVSD